MFRAYKDTNDIERDFCDKILAQCYQKGLEIMNVNVIVNQNIYNIWFDYALNCIKEVAQKTNDFSIVSEFECSKKIKTQYLYELVSENLNVLSKIRKKIFEYYSNIKYVSNNSTSYFNSYQYPKAFTPSFDYNSYANPYITPNTQELQYLKPINNQSHYNNYYTGLTSVLTSGVDTNEKIVLSILNATGNNYTKTSFLNLPIGVAKIISDASIEFLASKLKDEYPNNPGAHLIIDGIKELAKEKMKSIIDEWYRQRDFRY